MWAWCRTSNQHQAFTDRSETQWTQGHGLGTGRSISCQWKAGSCTWEQGWGMYGREVTSSSWSQPHATATALNGFNSTPRHALSPPPLTRSAESMPCSIMLRRKLFKLVYVSISLFSLFSLFSPPTTISTITTTLLTPFSLGRTGWCFRFGSCSFGSLPKLPQSRCSSSHHLLCSKPFETLQEAS